MIRQISKISRGFLYKYMILTSVNLKEINASEFFFFFSSEYKLSWLSSFIEICLQKKQKVDLPQGKHEKYVREQ